MHAIHHHLALESCGIRHLTICLTLIKVNLDNFQQVQFG
jgi:hypothetical protein